LAVLPSSRHCPRRLVALKPMHGEVMLMGDLVLLEAEVNPVMAELMENGIEITATSNDSDISIRNSILIA
jgi:hypothetical protein